MFTFYNPEVMNWSGDMADKIGTGECGEILIYQTDNGQTNKMYPSSFTRIQKQKSVHLRTENGCEFPENW